MVAILALVALLAADEAPLPDAGAPDAGAAAAALPPLKLAVPDPLGMEKAQKDAAAFAHALSEMLGRPVEGQAVSAKDIPALLAEGKIDFGWLSALEYVTASVQNEDVRPVARLQRGGLPFYRSVIFTRKDSGVEQLADLRGKPVALVAKSSAAGYLLPIRLLHAAGAIEVKLLGDHASVCRAVIDAKASAGATFSNEKDGRSAPDGCAESVGDRAGELRVLAASHPIPNDVVAVRAGLPQADADALREALFGLSQSDAGKALLEGTFHAEGFLACDDDDFTLLRDSLAQVGEAE
jgi:phosphonate transport system substrate-binding protein